MRLFEILVVALDCALLIYGMFFKKIARIPGIVLCLLTAGSLVMHLLHEGYRWQMVPAYAVTIIMVCILIVRMVRPMTNSGRKALRYTGYPLVFLILCVSIFLSLAIPAFNLPKPDGPYPVGKQTFHFTDDSRDESFTLDKSDKRELMVDVWYPAEAVQGEPSKLFPQNPKLFHQFMKSYAGGMGLPEFVLDYWKYIGTNSYDNANFLPGAHPYPVVIISHGMGTSRLLHVSQAEHLASLGYVVAAIDHTYSTMATLFPNGRVTGFQTEIEIDDFYNSASRIGKIWTADVAFVINQLEKLNRGQIASNLRAGMDLDHIGIMGHSFGGATAYNAAYTNEHIKAGIDMDGTLYNLDGKEPLAKPFMFMQTESSVVAMESNHTAEIPEDIERGMAAEKKTIQAVAAHGGYSLYVKGTAHYNFTDLQLYSPLLRYMGMTGSLSGKRGAEVVNQYVLDFFNTYLKGEKGGLISGANGHFPEVKVRFASGQ
jgi:dienelactone hydrolase